jgi:hypothetical protein
LAPLWLVVFSSLILENFVFFLPFLPVPLLSKYEYPEDMAATAVEEIRATSYVGFDTITDQIEHKLLKRGFQFNVIVVGASVSTFNLKAGLKDTPRSKL